MLGLMMDDQLSIIALLRFAARHHASTEIVSRSVEGPIHRYTYRDCYARTNRLAHALTKLGMKHGDRMATLAWNGYRHFELYYAIPGIGGVCHTINPRLFPEQIIYIVNHAEDRLLFVDLTFVPLIEKLIAHLPKLEAVVIMTDRAHMPTTTLPKALCYEDLLAAEPDTYSWPVFDERTASGLCYTSGTTGNPKGVMYTHRSTVLHAIATCQRDSSAPGAGEAILPIVPMFHVNAWGIPFGAPIGGFKLVFPGARYDGEAIHELLFNEKVVVTAGVPTVWMGLLDYLRKTGKTLPDLRILAVGGSALSRALCEAWEKEVGVQTAHGWGMTETSPAAVNNILAPNEAALPYEEKMQFKLSQGRGRFLVDLKIVDADGKELPQDGTTQGELCVRGPWIAKSYYRDETMSKSSWDAEGWFHTGDVASIDQQGYLHIVDRIKDIIKSGGEWVSSIDIENAAMLHPAVAEAAAIAKPDKKWGERPVLAVRLRSGANATGPDIIDSLRGSLAKWAVPDDVIFMDEFPYTATGKVAKRILREKVLGAVSPEKTAS